MIMRTLLSMVYRLFNPCWLTHASCICFKETALLFNVYLSWFVDFILCSSTCSKLTTKKIRLLIWCYCLLLPQSYQDSVSTFNFEHVFVSKVWKTSHNVLKTQKAKYLFGNKSCKVYFIQEFVIAPSWNELWTHNIVSVLNLLWEPQAHYHCFVPLFNLLYHRYFSKI